MTRYVVVCGQWYVAGVQPDTRHVWFTKEKQDAGSWSAYDRAVRAARFVKEWTRSEVVLQAVEEPDYPKSWAAVKDKQNVV
jgi:hypothetical protein